MLYLLFFLVIVAGIVYLTIPFIRGDGFALATDPNPEGESAKLKDQAESLKLALRDLDLENKIGKIDRNDFNLLKKELLAEWSLLEKQISEQEGRATQSEEVTVPALAEETVRFCPACGKPLANPAQDRYCRYCGTALKVLPFFLSLVFSLLAAAEPLTAYEIRVKLVNGSNPKAIVQAESISLLSLENAMQEIRRLDNPGSKAIFSDLPEPKNAPYMVQAKYRGVNYSLTIPPNRSSPAEVNLEVFEKTSQTKDILFRMLSEVRYIEGEKLHVFILYYILNNSKYTFADNHGGIQVFIPQGAQEIAASASVGSGGSNIQWLRLEPNATGDDWYSLPYPVKPGERMYQLEYKLAYQRTGTTLTFGSRYPLEVPLKLVVAPSDIRVTLKGQEVPALQDENLQRPIRDIPLKTKVSLNLSGGSPIAGSEESTAEQVQVSSPLSPYEKITGAALALLLIFAAFFYLQSNPAWLQKARAREKIRLQMELQLTNLSTLPEEQKQRRLSELKQRLRQLEALHGQR